MKFAICNEIFQDWKLEEAMAYAKNVGYDAIEIAPFTLAKSVTEISGARRKQIRESALEMGMEISGIHWVLAQTAGLHLTHPESAVRERTANYFSHLVDFCADIGGQFIVVGSPKQRSVMDEVSLEQGWIWATEVLRPAVKLAGQRDVTIGLEPLAPGETNFINTADEAIRFTRQFDSPRCKIVLDVKAMCSEAKPIPQLIREAWPDFVYFHANDRNLKGPGFGDVDFHPIAAALRKVGYDGFVSVEVFEFAEGAEVIATKSLEYLKKVFALSPG